MDALKLINQSSLKAELPVLNIGDTVKVHVKIKEGEKERIQLFEGTIIAKKHGGVEETFTVRRVSHGCGIERVFPVHSPNVAKVEIVRFGKVRRGKLYYLRDRVGKAAKVKEKLRKASV
jgi:large subunit ribosomal protein L19